jgi:hypothetical protein
MSEDGLYVRNRASYSTTRSLKNAAKIHVGFFQKGLENGLRSNSAHNQQSKLRQPIGKKNSIQYKNNAL